MQEWFAAFQSWLKTTMPQTRGFNIKRTRVLFKEIYHCIYSNSVKKSKVLVKMKRPDFARIRNIDCNATIHFRLKQQRLLDSHPLEIKLTILLTRLNRWVFDLLNKKSAKNSLDYFKTNTLHSQFCIFMKTISTSWKLLQIEPEILVTIMLQRFFSSIVK